jgi:hypothetical protein
MTTTHTETIRYGNATEKQRELIERFIRRDLGRCQTSLVEEMLSVDSFTGVDLDMIENLFATGVDSEPQDIFEWWPISDQWVTKRLIEMGEPVIDSDYGAWWGRTSTGQRIALDSTWWEMYQDAITDNG